MARKKQGNIRRAKKQGGPRPTPHKKTCGFACAFLAEIQPKKTPHTPYGEFFSADFISKIHWQNCFAPKKSKFCAELRRDGAGILTHGKTAQRRSPCKICLLRRMFSYAESAKAALLGAKGMLCYGSGISLLSKRASWATLSSGTRPTSTTSATALAAILQKLSSSAARSCERTVEGEHDGSD